MRSSLKSLFISILGNAAWELLFKPAFLGACGVPITGALVATVNIFRALHWWEGSALFCVALAMWLLLVALPRVYRTIKTEYRLRHPIGDEKYVFAWFFQNGQRTVTLPGFIETADHLVGDGLLTRYDPKPATYSMSLETYEIPSRLRGHLSPVLTAA
jgi:hypothetical protein